MQPRALSRLMNISPEKRLNAIAEGLGLLAEQVEALGEDLAALAETRRLRGHAMLSAHVDEEAAKALILLDTVRMDQRDHKGIAIQLERFYNHLARCIYVEMAWMSPADFAEVRMLVDTMRPSLYLDGPNDVDWIFRNQLLTQREENLYVDYVHEEEGDRWITPATNDEFMLPASRSPIRDLLTAMHRLGCTTPEGLAIIAEAWAQKTIDDATRWPELVAINRSIADELLDAGIASASATAEDIDRVVDWPFPMGSLDLSKLPVSASELEAERERWSPE